MCVDLYKHDEYTKGITKKSGQCHGCNGFGLVCYFVCLFYNSIFTILKRAYISYLFKAL